MGSLLAQHSHLVAEFAFGGRVTGWHALFPPSQGASAAAALAHVACPPLYPMLTGLARRSALAPPSRPLQGQDIPPIAFLRHPRIVEVLLLNLFSPGRQLQPEAVQAYSGLLALAAAADDRRPSGPADGAAAAGEAGGGGEGAQQQQQQQQQQGSSVGGGGGDLDLSAVPATKAALEAAAELAQRVMQVGLVWCSAMQPTMQHGCACCLLAPWQQLMATRGPSLQAANTTSATHCSVVNHVCPLPWLAPRYRRIKRARKRTWRLRPPCWSTPAALQVRCSHAQANSLPACAPASRCRTVAGCQLLRRSLLRMPFCLRLQACCARWAASCRGQTTGRPRTTCSK